MSERWFLDAVALFRLAVKSALRTAFTAGSKFHPDRFASFRRSGQTTPSRRCNFSPTLGLLLNFRGITYGTKPMPPSTAKKSSGNRALPKAPTGIQGLDEITGGGFPQGRPTLVCGSAGCEIGRAHV